jgi:hypothetical protein
MSQARREQLQIARGAVTQSKDAMKLQVSSKKTSTRKKVAHSKAAVKVPPAKAQRNTAQQNRITKAGCSARHPVQ